MGTLISERQKMIAGAQPAGERAGITVTPPGLAPALHIAQGLRQLLVIPSASSVPLLTPVLSRMGPGLTAKSCWHRTTWGNVGGRAREIRNLQAHHTLPRGCELQLSCRQESPILLALATGDSPQGD